MISRPCLDIRHWEMLVAIDDAGTLQAAAEKLCVTQSALSHRLAEAERRLGGSFYERDGRQLRLAPAGRAAPQTARQVLPALLRAESDFRAMTQQQAPVVRFGVAAYSAYQWLPHFLRILGAGRERVQMEIVAS